MRKWMGLFIFLAGFFVADSANASVDLIKCDHCTSAEMKQTAEDIAARKAGGRYVIKVINMPQADYREYQIDKLPPENSEQEPAYRLVTVELVVPNLTEIKQNMTDLNAAIANMKAMMGGKSVPPDDFIYSIIGGAENAILVKCDNCSSVDMKRAAQSVAGGVAHGRYKIQVINVPDAEYREYQIDKMTSDNSDSDTEYKLATTDLVVLNSLKIKRNIKSLNASIAELTRVMSAKILLPKDFAFKSATEALQAPESFAKQVQDFLNNQHEKVKSAVFDVGTTAEATEQSLNASRQALLIVTTALTSENQAEVIFTDDSRITFQYYFGQDASKGLTITMSSSPKARDSAGKLVPRNPIETRGYSAEQRNIDLAALVLHLSQMGIIIRSQNQGQSTTCLPVQLVCKADGKSCDLTYKCD